MPCEIEWHGKNIYWNFSGFIEAEDLIATFNGFYGDGRFDNTRAQIRNYSHVTGGNITLDDIKRIAAYDRAAAKTNPTMKVALVLASKHQDYTALLSFYDAELHNSPWQVSFFDCVEDAIAWVA